MDGPCNSLGTVKKSKALQLTQNDQAQRILTLYPVNQLSADASAYFGRHAGQLSACSRAWSWQFYGDFQLLFDTTCKEFIENIYLLETQQDKNNHKTSKQTK